MKIILNKEEKECINNVGYLVVSLLIEEDFKITYPYKMFIEDKVLVIKKTT